jgi:hypothetical protein
MPNFKISQLTTATAVSATNQFEINQNAASRSLEVSVLSTYIRSGDSGKAIVVSVSTASDAVRITQTGTGNALVVEDSTNPDSSPFVVDASGNVGVGTGTPTAKLDIGSGNLSFTSTGQRITGDFSNGTQSNRVFFQTTTAGGGTSVGTIPNATGVNSAFNAFGGPDPGNASFAQLRAGSDTSDVRLTSGINGTGTYYPMTFYTGGSERMRLDTSGNVGIGTTSTTANAKLAVEQGIVARASTAGLVPYLQLYNSNAGTDLKTWRFGGDSAGSLSIETVNDAYSAAVQRLVINSSGNVGIGTSSPNSLLELNKASGAADFRLSVAGTLYGNIYASSSDMTINSVTAIPLSFGTNSTERMRIDSSGNLLVGAISTLFASSHAFVNSGAAVLGLRNSGSTAGKYWQLGPDSNSSFKVYNQDSVGMFLSDGSTSWSSSSDERQKNIIEPISDATKKVASLRAVIGSYKSDETNKRRSFLIAQDVQQVLPEAVTEAPDGFLGVAYSDVIPLLVAAIQELKAEFDAYKAAHP